MSNHVHVLVQVTERGEISDEGLLVRGEGDARVGRPVVARSLQRRIGQIDVWFPPVRLVNERLWETETWRAEYEAPV